MNETIINFIKSLNIDIEKFNSLEGAKVKRSCEVNPIISRFGIYKRSKEGKLVSIADVVGYDSYDSNTNLLDNLSNYFDRDGDGYHRRSVSMLDIPQNQVMDTLSKSFQEQPICLIEIDKGKYNIGRNGMHRFHFIKTHYLNELSKINQNDNHSIKKLNEKYSFPAEISEIDFVKTYSAYLLNRLDYNLELRGYLDSNFEVTDKSCLINHLKPEEKIVLTDEQLIEFVNKKINQFSAKASRKERKELKEELKNSFKFESFENYFNNALVQIQRGE